MKRSKKLKYDHIALFAEGEVDTQEMVGTVFYKQIAKFGKWINPLFPIEFMELDKEWAQTIVDNFESGVIEHVPVPLDHTDQTEANTGEVLKLEIKEDGLYAYLDIRRPNVVDDIVNGLIFDVSISFDWDYIDTADGKHWGPTLLHVALVNNPYLKGMPEFEEAQVGSYSEQWGKLQTTLALPKSSSVIMLSESKVKELNMETVTVKNDKEFDVTISVKNDEGEAVDKVLKPGEEAEVPKDQSEEVLGQITDAVDPEAETDEEKKAREEQEEADRKKKEEEDAGLSDDEKQAKKDQEELADLRQKQALSEVAKSYTTLLSAGKITPAQKDAFMQLAEAHTTKVELSGKQVSLSKIVTDILEAGPKRVNFSENGSGKEGGEGGEGEGSGDDKKPSESLSDVESKGMQAVGADPKRMDELSEKYPAMKSALNQTKESKENK